MRKEFDLCTRDGQKVINVKRINVHSFFVDGQNNTPFANVYKRMTHEEFKTYKDRFYLVTEEENMRRIDKGRQRNETVLELLLKANYNINVSTGSLHEDNQNETLGKHQLKRVIDLVSNGKELSDKVAK